MEHTGPLPQRFVCQLCGVCIATAEDLQAPPPKGQQDNTFVFARLHGGGDSDKAAGSKTVTCPCCGQALGSRANTGFQLRQDRLRRRDTLEVVICAMKDADIQEVSPIVRELLPQSRVTPRVLVKSELRGFQFGQKTPVPDLVIVVVRNEGRVLITDRNGLFHDVLGSAWQLTVGNAIVVVTKTPPKGSPSDLFDSQLLRALSTQGDQPTVGALSACGRVLTWEGAPSAPQRRQLRSLLESAYFRALPTANVNGIPSQWLPKKPSKANSSAWCSLL